jgi:adenine-specific DNA-methyltransferase
LKKLIEKAETPEEAIAIQQLGTMWKKTGFSYDVRLEKMTDDIYYFKKDEKLSFTQPEAKQTHKLIIGDNCKALLNLQQEYQGKIKMIYIDPPYGKDSMGQFAQTNYKNNITRDNLLSMLEPRLRLARNLLSDDGVIFCSIDDKNQAYVKILFDEVFGEGNFVENLIWLNKEGGGKSDSKYFRTKHEYLLCYAKNTNILQINGLDVEDIDRYTLQDEYVEERGKYQLVKLDSGSLGWVKSLDYPIEYDGQTIYAGGDKEKWEERQAGKGGSRDWGWRWSKDKLDWGIKNDFIVFKKNKDGVYQVYTKQYLNCDKDGNITARQNQPVSYLEVSSTTQANRMIKEIFEKVPFTYTKPTALIQHLLKIASQKNSIILDFFAGSGTTGQAVLEQNKTDGGNRQFILVQLDEEVEGIQKEFCEKNNLPLNLASITYERLKRVMTGKASDGSNFKWLEKNEKLGDNLLVCEVSHCANFDKNVFENIDETLYGLEKFEKPIDKINWVCDNFEGTQKVLENKDGKQENKQGFIEE